MNVDKTKARLSKHPGKQKTKTEDRPRHVRTPSPPVPNHVQKQGSGSAAHMRYLVTIAALKVPGSQQDAPSRCVLHMTVTCLCKFQRLGIAH